MPPKGWKKPDNKPDDRFADPIPVGQIMKAPVVTINDHVVVDLSPKSDPPSSARKSGLSANLDPIARERIIAVNDVTIRCMGSLGKFDFPAMWLKQFPATIPAGELTPRLKSAVMAADEIYINCKQRRPNDPEVTVNHSRHEANWLKEYV